MGKSVCSVPVIFCFLPMEALCRDFGIVRFEFNSDEPALEPQAHLSYRARTEKWIEHHVIGVGSGKNRRLNQDRWKRGEVSIRDWLSVDAPNRSPVPAALL